MYDLLENIILSTIEVILIINTVVITLFTLLTLLAFIHIILNKICDIVLDTINNVIYTHNKIILARLLQKHYKKKKLIKDIESIIPIIEEIYYSPNMKGYYLCLQRFEKICKEIS